MKKEWPEYLPTAEDARGRRRHARPHGVSRGAPPREEAEDRLQEGLGKVAYHAACHLRAQKIAYPGMRILERVPDTEVRIVEQCSAVDGTWGMKAQYYEMGRKYAQKLVRGIGEGEGETVVSDCSARCTPHRERKPGTGGAPHRSRARRLRSARRVKAREGNEA